MGRHHRLRDVQGRIKRSPRGVTGAAVACLGLLASACAGAGSSGNGRWAMATVLPESRAGFGTPTSLWCGSLGNCVVSYYLWADPAFPQHSQVFASSEVRGTWGRPQPIRGLAAPENASLLAGISCTSTGNCLAAGNYKPVPFPKFYGQHAAAAREVNGAWRPAVPIPGLAALSHRGSCEITQLSCSET